ncbi:MAG: hypothetical protein PWQ55_2480 [Chloroflexota bacterium]|nr:hypothetical protein [Chloroflexota bacterium]
MIMIKVFRKVKQKVQERIYPSFSVFISSTIIGFSLGYLIYTNFLQRHFFSWRYLFYSVIIFVGVSLLAGWINTKYLFPWINQISRQKRVVLFVLVFSITIISLFSIKVKPLYYLLPDSTIEISFNISDKTNEVQLLWINTGQGFIPHSKMRISGNYSIINDIYVFPPNQSVKINWQGKAGPESQIAFLAAQVDQEVSVNWNGQISSFNLIGDKNEQLIFQFSTSVPLWLKIFWFNTSLNVISYLLILFIFIVNSWKPNKCEENRNKSFGWLRFMLPMLLVWIFTLLIFWPGVLSNDSRELWRQAVSGDFNDWQSAIFAAIIYLLIRIDYSLSFVIALQIFFTAAVVAYGLGRLENRNVPKAVLWLISLFFAFSPLNNMQMITLWKDVSYSTSVLWLTILFFEIYDSNGAWINKKRNIILLLFVSLLISLLRLNGLPVSAVSLLILSFVFKRCYKQFLGILIVLIFLFIFAKGPFYDFIGVDKEINGQSNLILVHHIAAHIDGGTKMTDEELDYLNNLLPISEWDYQCCYYIATTSHKDFNSNNLMNNSSYNRRLALDLFLRDPLVDIRHTLCSGELAWRFGQGKCKTFSSHGFNNWSKNGRDWIVSNDFGLTENSLVPDLVQNYVDVLRKFGFLDDNLVFYLKPAFSFYFSLIWLIIAYIRNRDWKIFVIVIPILLQTGILFLINFAPVIRYFFSTHMVSIFLFAIVFYKKREIY